MVVGLYLLPYAYLLPAPGVSNILQSRRELLGGYRPKRYSKAKRASLMRMHDSIYSQGDESMATKAAAKKSDAAMFKYIDRNGIEQEIDLSQVKNLDETFYAESNELFPDAEQCFLHNPSKSEGTVDEMGRESVLNDNVCLIDAVRMTMGDYGPWFLVRAIHPVKGEISFPVSGIAASAIESLSAIDLKTGDKLDKAKEFPVWAKFEFVQAGDFNGYFVCNPAVKQADVIEAE